MGLQVLFEDDSVLILNKPSGIIVHSDGRTDEPSVADWLIARNPACAEIGEPWISPQGTLVRTAGLVHRLDRTTSGVLTVAKTAVAYSHLKRQFKERKVLKKYVAMVYGSMPADRGKIVAEIMRSSVPPKKWFARPTTEDDRRAAITCWEVKKLLFVQGGYDVSYVSLEPKTGRTHQIRVHLASIGHPLLSDHLYAADHSKIAGFDRPALHAQAISFELEDGRNVYCEAPLPIDFTRALQ